MTELLKAHKANSIFVVASLAGVVLGLALVFAVHTAEVDKMIVHKPNSVNTGLILPASR